jgi:hypothetical protein
VTRHLHLAPAETRAGDSAPYRNTLVENTNQGACRVRYCRAQRSHDPRDFQDTQRVAAAWRELYPGACTGCRAFPIVHAVSPNPVSCASGRTTGVSDLDQPARASTQSPHNIQLFTTGEHPATRDPPQNRVQNNSNPRCTHGLACVATVCGRWRDGAPPEPLRHRLCATCTPPLACPLQRHPSHAVNSSVTLPQRALLGPRSADGSWEVS